MLCRLQAKMFFQEAHEAFSDWFSHSSSAPQKPTPAPEVKFTERVANEMREKEYQVREHAPHPT